MLLTSVSAFSLGPWEAGTGLCRPVATLSVGADAVRAVAYAGALTSPDVMAQPLPIHLFQAGCGETIAWAAA